MSGIEEYIAKNEPVYGYEVGSAERKALDAKVEEYDSKVHEIPIVIGNEEIASKDIRFQVKVFTEAL